MASLSWACWSSWTTLSMGVPSRTSAPTPVLIRATWIQIILEKVRPFASPGRGPSTGSDHCSGLPVRDHHHAVVGAEAAGLHLVVTRDRGPGTGRAGRGADGDEDPRGGVRALHAELAVLELGVGDIEGVGVGRDQHQRDKGDQG